MEVIVHVRLRDMGSALCYRASGWTLKSGDFVILEVERGIDYG